MLRLNINSGLEKVLKFKSLDLIHDGAVNMLKATGLTPEELVGHKALPWTVGPVFAKSVEKGAPEKQADRIVMTTCDPKIAEHLLHAKLSDFKATRYSTGEVLDLSKWSIDVDSPPVIDGQEAMAVVAGSPLVFRRKGNGPRRWVVDVKDMDLSAAVNSRLSRLAGREVRLQVVPDERYISSKKSHAVYTRLKAEQGVGSTVIGLSFPMIIYGPTEDLELAWYAGFGELTRMGFGILALRKK